MKYLYGEGSRRSINIATPNPFELTNKRCLNQIFICILGLFTKVINNAYKHMVQDWCIV